MVKGCSPCGPDGLTQAGRCARLPQEPRQPAVLEDAAAGRLTRAVVFPQNATRRTGGSSRTARSQVVLPIPYPVTGCVPQSGDCEPPVWVTCVKAVPSTLTT